MDIDKIQKTYMKILKTCKLKKNFRQRSAPVDDIKLEKLTLCCNYDSLKI